MSHTEVKNAIEVCFNQ